MHVITMTENWEHREQTIIGVCETGGKAKEVISLLKEAEAFSKQKTLELDQELNKRSFDLKSNLLPKKPEKAKFPHLSEREWYKNHFLPWRKIEAEYLEKDSLFREKIGFTRKQFLAQIVIPDHLLKFKDFVRIPFYDNDRKFYS